MIDFVKWDVFGMLAALPRYCTDGRRHSYGLLRLLPGGKELTDYGLLQKSDTSGRFNRVKFSGHHWHYRPCVIAGC